MPYHIGHKGSHGCKGFPVIKDSDDEVMGCHKTKADAIVAKLEAEFCNDCGDLNIHLMEVDECEKLMEFFKHES